MSKIDWIIHCVSDTVCDACGNPEYVDEVTRIRNSLFPIANYHTHGLEAHGINEICVCMNIMYPDDMASFINNVALYFVDNNEQPVVGKRYSNFLKNGYDIMFHKVDNCDILFLFFPDENNKFPQDSDCKLDFKMQKIFAQCIVDEEDYV